jgi:cellulose synthase (UDP-forming)
MRHIGTILLWALVSALVMLVITLPINLQTQLIASIAVVTFMAVIKVLRAEGIWRLIALAFGTAVVLRYVYWRTTSTLPPVNQLSNFIPGLLLYLAEMYSVFMLALSLFVVAMPLPPREPPKAEDGEAAVRRRLHPHLQRGPRLLADTIAAAKAMDYPADQASPSGCSTMAARSRSAMPRTCSRRSAAEARHRELSDALPRRWAQLSDARPQRACQGRQSQQRPGSIRPAS